MQRYALGVVVVWWRLLSMVLAAETQEMHPDERVGVGHQYFVRYCSTCHGVEGRGDGPAASTLQPAPADLTCIAQRRGGYFPVAEITAHIDGRTSVPAHGRREMPIWGVYFGERALGSAHSLSRVVLGLTRSSLMVRIMLEDGGARVLHGNSPP